MDPIQQARVKGSWLTPCNVHRLCIAHLLSHLTLTSAVTSGRIRRLHVRDGPPQGPAMACPPMPPP